MIFNSDTICLFVGENRQFKTVQAAIEAASSYPAGPLTIYIDPGKYYEKLEITRPYLTLEGISPLETILTYDDCANALMPDATKRGTFRSYTLLADAAHITLRNLTVENSAGSGKKVGQAIALYAEGEGILVENCRLLGDQDTLFTGPLPPKEIQPGGFIGPKQFSPRINGRQYYKNTYICGGVDFIFGSATAYFENCTIESLDAPIGYVTAGSSPKDQEYGYVFDRCRFIGKGTPASRYLGRPWREYAKVVLLNCEIGEHIHPEGWHDWGKTNARRTVYFAEYHCFGPGSTGNRPDWVHTLTDDEAKHYTKKNILGYE